MRATITDLKLKDCSRYKVDLSSANTYYPFGMLMPERNWSTDGYRYGFNGQEKDDEIKGEGNTANHDFVHPIGLIHNIPDEGEKITPEQFNTRVETDLDYRDNGTKNVMFQTDKPGFDSKINSIQQGNATKNIKESRKKKKGL